jgi:ATP-dependent RNA helicase DHX57
VPQYVLDSLINSNKGASASILVTQPRRISAISVAARVSAERLDDGSVGYAIRGESKQSKRTKLLFCTTGVVLRRLGSGDDLLGVTHVIIDEVHERSVDSDFLLLEMKDILKRHKTLKIILMSATINHETFVRYFGGCPLLTIPGRTYPVTDIYLEDVFPRLDYRPNGKTPGKKQADDSASALVKQLEQKGYDEATINSIQSIGASDRTDYQLISLVVNHIIKASEKGGILIFLQGVQEIRQCIDSIRNVISDGIADIFPLHANLSSNEQKRVFFSTSKWKIVVSTNVAETSITIDDIIYVIDSGKVKESQYDAESGLCRLVETWTTKAAARQRRGRAGRTQPGKCYKLYTRMREASLVNFPVPEILRVPLENVLLTIKVIRESEDPAVYLGQAIDPPKTSAMNIAWSILQELGAVDTQGNLTALGRHISRIPVDLRLGKMLVLGTIFRCLGPILTIAALLSSKPLFVSPLDKRDEASSARMKFATGDSDLLTDLHAYNACMDLDSQGRLIGAVKAFCEKNFISSTTVREVSTLRSDFLSALSERGLVPLSASSTAPHININSKNINLLKSVILGGLWPRICRVHLPRSAVKFDKVSAGTVRRENTAKEYKIFDIRDGRVFLHPASVLFHSATWRSPFLVYFNKHKTTKVFLRDATQVPLYALLLFGGQVTVNHVKGGLTVSSGSGEHFIQLKAWPRIGILVNHLK